MSKYHKDLSVSQIIILEKLADIEHQRWSDWQKYLHSKGAINEDDGNMNLVIPGDLVKNWDRQMKTDYKDLSESEKDSDREQVMRYWDLLKV